MNTQEREFYNNKISALEAEIAELKGQLKANDSEKEFPQTGDKFYFITADGDIDYIPRYTEEDELDVACLSIGNVFRTEEEAKFEVERLKVIHELKQYAEPFIPDKEQWFLRFNSDMNMLSYEKVTYILRTDIYFNSVETAQDAVTNVGEERIIKYYFRQNIKED